MSYVLCQLNHFNMKKLQTLLTLITGILLFSTFQSSAQVDLSIQNMEVIGTDVYFDVYLNSTGTSFGLDTSNLSINFNASNFVNPVLELVTTGPSSGSSGISTCNFTSINYPDPSEFGAQLFVQGNYALALDLGIVNNQLNINVRKQVVNDVATYNDNIAMINNNPNTHRLSRFRLRGYSFVNCGPFAGFSWDLANTAVYEILSTTNFPTQAVAINTTDVGPEVCACFSAYIVQGNGISCNGSSDGELTVVATGGTPPYTYEWSNLQTGASINNLGAGSYSLTVSDATNCSTTASFNFIEPTPLNSTIDILDYTGCNPIQTYVASVTSTGGTAPYTYEWNNGEMYATATYLTPITGINTVTVTDANGCVDERWKIPNPLIPDAYSLPVSCSSSSNGTASAYSSGGISPYSYLWDNGETTYTASNLTPGNHTVTISDGTGCSVEDMVTVTVSGGLNVNAYVNLNASCNGLADGSAGVTVSGGTSNYNYLWSNGTTTSIVSYLSAGYLEVTVTDTNGCSATDGITVQNDININVSTSVINHVTCNGLSDGSATVLTTGGTLPYTYLWDTGETTSISTQLVSAVHSVTVTAANGCFGMGYVAIQEPSALIATISILSQPTSNGNDGIAEAVVTGGTPPYTYEWPNGELTSTAIGLSSGGNAVTVTDANGCTGVANVTLSSCNLTVNTTIINGSTCSTDGAAEALPLGGTPPYTYLWSGGQVTATVTNLNPGYHEITVTDNDGCLATNSVSIISDGINAVFTTVNNHVTCNGEADGSATVFTTEGTPPYTYTWINGETNATAIQLNAGSHQVTLTDVNGCIGISNVTILEADVLIVDINPISPPTSNGNDGIAEAVVTGGTPPYTYEWPNGELTSTAIGLSSGGNAVTVTDANGCTGVANVTLISCNLTVNTTIINGSTCSTDGAAEALPLGGTPPYTYLWSGGEATAMVTNLNPGYYEITVTDADGCSDTADITIFASQLFPTTTVNNDVSCNSISDGSATVFITGGTPPYTYLWDDTEDTATAVALTEGLHIVTVTDSGGCSGTASANIGASTTLAVDFTAPFRSCIGNSLFTNNTTGATSYEWLVDGVVVGNQTDLNYNFTSAGSYTVTLNATATGACAGTNTQSQNINVTPSSASLNLPLTADFCETTGTLDAQLSNMAIYIWDFQGTNVGSTSSITVTQAGIYNLVVLDSCGFSNSASIEVFFGNDCVWPGDVNYDYVVDYYDLVDLGFGIFGETGAARPNASSNWIGQSCQDWNNVSNLGINLKHYDCDGNGIIDVPDSQVVQDNYGSIRTPKTSNKYQKKGIGNYWIRPTIDPNLSSNAMLNISLEFEDDSGAAAEVYALVCRMDYGLTLGASTNFSNSLLGTAGNDLLTLSVDYPSDHIVVGATRNDLQNVNLKGKFADVQANIDPSTNFIQVNLLETFAIQSSRDELNVNSYLLNVFLGDSNSQNPLNYYINAKPFTCDRLGEAEVIILNGQAPFAYQWDSGATTSTVDQLAAGRHYVTVTDANGEATAGFMDVGEVNEECGRLLLSSKIYLQGAYEASSGLMNDNLRQNELIPLFSPYNPDVSMNEGVELTTGNDAIVDWVQVELRDASNPSDILAQKEALLKRDGYIVATDGISDVGFEDLPDGEYYVVINHRNHLSVMSASPIALDRTTSSFLDFTNGNAYGTAPMYLFPNGITALYSGDATNDNLNNASDRSSTWNDRNQMGYLNSDCNLDGNVDASDRSITWNNRNKFSLVP